MTERERDEILECIWMVEEDGRKTTSEEILRCLEAQPCKVEEPRKVIEDLARQGLVAWEGEELRLTEAGRGRARDIIRRHRLAERLLMDVLQMGEELTERGACTLEHALSPEVTDAVCTFLGHPKTCPHGKPIPPGPCCERFEKEVRPITLPLIELSPGEEGRVVFITPSVHARLDRLAGLGLIPGAVVRLHQRRPSAVVKVGETEIALSPEIAREIYVRPLSRKR